VILKEEHGIRLQNSLSDIWQTLPLDKEKDPDISYDLAAAYSVQAWILHLDLKHYLEDGQKRSVIENAKVAQSYKNAGYADAIPEWNGQEPDVDDEDPKNPRVLRWNRMRTVKDWLYFLENNIAGYSLQMDAKCPPDFFRLPLRFRKNMQTKIKT
jgi:hypothetical protein